MNRSISIRTLTEDELKTLNLHPHAIINKPMSYFEIFGVKFIHDHDDLDYYDASEFMLEYKDNEIPCMLFHRKHPIDEIVNIFLPFNFNERQVDLALTKILAIFELSDADVYWKQGEYFDYNDGGKVDRARRMEDDDEQLS